MPHENLTHSRKIEEVKTPSDGRGHGSRRDRDGVGGVPSGKKHADWHRLLEICALSDTLILDEDGVYDPTCFNDRLLLGLKGTMSEAELHVLKARLRGGILNKVRRGEYRCPLPTGLAYDEQGQVVLDPDAQVRESITHFFNTFLRAGSACQTVKIYRKEGLRFPSRLRVGGAVAFRPLTASTAMRTLTNPRYAGAYVYGRRRCRRAADGKKKIRRLHENTDWLACIPEAHPGYITWERFQQNLRILKSNGRGFELARASPPREGAALLQGRAVCGRCGQYMRVRYADRRGREEGWYVCDGTHRAHDNPTCQSIAAWPVDAVVGALVAERMTPEAVKLSLEIRREIEARYEEADRLRARALERAQFEADLAQRRFMMVDPNNRLVADTLEAEWNSKLRALAEAREQRERVREADRQVLDKSTRERLLTMTTDFGKLWADPRTANRERKRMLSYLIEDATLIKCHEEGVSKIHVRFKGGLTETLTAENPKSSCQQIRTQPKIVKLVDKLLDDCVYEEIAERLNDQGLQPGGAARPGKGGLRFTNLKVSYLVNTYGLRSRFDRLRERGMLTGKEAARRLGVHEATLIRWANHGLVKRHAYNAHCYLYELPESIPEKHSSRWDRLDDRAAAIKMRQRKTR